MPDLDLLQPRRMRVGDSDPDLDEVLRDEAGDPLDLTDWTATGGTLRLREVETGAVVLGAGTITFPHPELGEVHYAFAAADTASAGLYDVLLRLDTGDGFETILLPRKLVVDPLPAPAGP